LSEIYIQISYFFKINVCNSLTTSVDFSAFSAFKRSFQRVNLNELLTAYKSFDVYDCA